MMCSLTSSVWSVYNLIGCSLGTGLSVMHYATTWRPSLGYRWHVSVEVLLRGCGSLKSGKGISSVFCHAFLRVIYHELVLTTKEYMRETTAIDPRWLVEFAPAFFKFSDPTKLSKRKRQERIEPLYNRYELNITACMTHVIARTVTRIKSLIGANCVWLLPPEALDRFLLKLLIAWLIVCGSKVKCSHALLVSQRTLLIFKKCAML